jgi:hypothetical protein
MCLVLEFIMLGNSNAGLIVIVGACGRKPSSPSMFLSQIDFCTADETAIY